MRNLFLFFIQSLGFAQALPAQPGQSPAGTAPEIFQLPTLRYLSVNPANPRNYFNFLLDKGNPVDLRGLPLRIKGEKLSMRCQQIHRDTFDIKFFNNAQQEVGYINIITPLKLNYIYINPLFRSNDYAKFMFGAVLKVLQEGVLTGQKASFVELYVRNPLIADMVSGYGFILNQNPSEEMRGLMTKVILSKEKYANGKVRLYIVDEKKKQNILTHINASDNSDWFDTFQVVDTIHEGKISEVTIFAEYYLYGFDGIDTHIQELGGSVFLKPAASPLRGVTATQGGIDLSQIELTLKDEKFISTLNPADLKILRAAKYLKQWPSLSLLYVHEVLLMIQDNLVHGLKQKILLHNLLAQLQAVN